MRLAEPYWLLLLALMPLPWLFARARPRISWPSLAGFERIKPTWASRLRGLPVLCRMLAIACLAVALARPQTVGGRTRIAGQGVEIVVALDNSSSMTRDDFPTEQGTITRLEAAKTTFARFVQGRPDDLIGLVVFANFPDVASPPTLNHTSLLGILRAVRSARPGDDGTNLGAAIAWSLGALSPSRAPTRKKVIILLTDGRNDPADPDPLDPEDQAKLAHELGVTLHTIAVGKAGGVVRRTDPDTGLPIPSEVPGPDFALLERLARAGGGRAFTAADSASLSQVFQTIDALEKSPVRGQVFTRYDERFFPWAGAALALLALDRLLSAGRLRRLP